MVLMVCSIGTQGALFPQDVKRPKVALSQGASVSGVHQNQPPPTYGWNAILCCWFHQNLERAAQRLAARVRSGFSCLSAWATLA